MARSEAQIKADVKWHRKAYERIPFDVRRDAELNGDAIRSHAEKMGESLSGFLKRAVAETIERDRQRMAQESQEPTD